MREFDIQRIVIHASFFTEPLAPTLRYCLETLSIPAELEFLPPANVLHNLLTYAPNERQSNNQIHLLLITQDDIKGRYTGNKANHEYEDHGFLPILDSFLRRLQAFCFIAVCPLAGSPTSELVETLRAAYKNQSRVHVYDLATTLDAYYVRKPFNSSDNNDWLCPYTNEGYVGIAIGVARSIASHHLPPCKVLAVDCDGTLWDGACGERESLSVMRANASLQELLVRQRDAGALLAVVSRNDIADVVHAFQHVDGMLLKSEDISIWKVNWNRKSLNVWSLLTELHFPPESVLFIDDDEFECAEVEKNCPGVPTLHLAGTPDERELVLKRCWLLDNTRQTREDQQRATLHAVDKLRQQYSSESLNLTDFLEYSHLRITIRTATVEDAHRIAQLTQRTNQFNSTGDRWNEVQIAKVMKSIATRIWVASAEDDFGSYGVIAAAICELRKKSIIIQSFTISCRALRRHVEDTTLALLGRFAEETGRNKIAIRFRQTGRNGRFAEFCDRVSAVVHAARQDDSLVCETETLRRVVIQTSFGYMIGPYEEINVAQELAAEDTSETEACSLRAATPISRYLTLMKPLRNAKDVINMLGKGETISVADAVATQVVSVRLIIESIWRRLLGAPSILPNDDFFALGGDSLQALEMIYEINDRFRVQVELSLLFESSFTMARLVESVEAML